MTLGPIALSVFMAFGQGADAVSTDRALSACPTCVEGNPLMRSQGVRYGTKGVIVATASVACFKLWPKHKTAAIVLGTLVGGSGIALAVHNNRMR